MEKYSMNGVSLLKNEKAIFPMMGEFHFSRCPEKEWEDEIRKMKACGMDIIATYVFWIHHEEEEGVFDFSGQRNLHYFLKLCEKWQMHPGRHGSTVTARSCDNFAGAPSETPAMLSELGHGS